MHRKRWIRIKFTNEMCRLRSEERQGRTHTVIVARNIIIKQIL